MSLYEAAISLLQRFCIPYTNMSAHGLTSPSLLFLSHLYIYTLTLDING